MPHIDEGLVGGESGFEEALRTRMGSKNILAGEVIIAEGGSETDDFDAGVYECAYKGLQLLVDHENNAGTVMLPDIVGELNSVGFDLVVAHHHDTVVLRN